MVDTTRYRLVRAAPDLDSYVRLRRVSGLSPKSAQQAAGPLEHSWAWCHVRATATLEVVAMGRVLGDGGWYFHLADIATDPAHQRQGLGRAVITDLLARIDDEAPPDPYVTLLADAPGIALYESLGFVPTAPRSIGMVRR